MTPPIAILGAGPGGLAVARFLEMNKIDYTIFERDADSRPVFTGGILDIHEDDGQLVLREAGLLDQFESLARYEAQALKVVDKESAVLWRKDYKGQKDRPEIDRTQLRDILLASVPDDKIRWGHRVESVSKNPDGTMRVHFTDGASESGFRLVVGADGAWSKARALVTPAAPVYSGFGYLQTSISPRNPAYARLAAFLGEGSYMCLTGGRAIIAQKLSTGLYNVYVGLALPEGWGKTHAELVRSPGFRQHLLDTYFGDWSDEPRSLIRDSDGDWHSWPLYCLPRDSLGWATVPGVALVGDAAHLSVPNGEGVNCALLDGYELAKEIIAGGLDDLDAAVARYEEKMLPRGRASIEKGEQFLDTFYGQDSPRGFMEWMAKIKVMIAEKEAALKGQ